MSPKTWLKQQSLMQRCAEMIWGTQDWQKTRGEHGSLMFAEVEEDAAGMGPRNCCNDLS